MPPSLRKRVWYQHYIGHDDLAHHSSLFQKRFCLDLLNNINKGSSRANNNKRWGSQSLRRCRSDAIKDNSSSYFNNDNLSKRIKEEVVDEQQLDKKRIIPLVNVAGKGHGRMLMRDWLEANADDGCMSGLKWLDKDLGLVQISWKHGSRAGWSRRDVEVFESWALHTGKFNPNKSDCKRWKANFRCALNSLPDVIEIKGICTTRSSNPYKVYRLLPPHDISKQIKSKRMKPAKLVRPKLLSKPEKLDLQIKVEPVDPDSPSLASDEECSKNVETFSPSSITDEIKFWNNELSICKDYVYEHRTLHPPIGFSDCEKQLEKETICTWHIDHSYANIDQHLEDKEKIIVQPELVDGLDLISTINEEFEKFCASNIYMDLWSEDTRTCREEFTLHDFNFPSYFDETL